MLPILLEPQGGEVQVNTYTADQQIYPSVTGLADGGYVVTWMSQSQDGSEYGVYAQRYADDGTASGGEFLVNSTTASEQYFPSITALSDGGFVVSWMSLGQDGGEYGVYAQRYAADGTASGGEFQVNSTTAFHQYEPSITALADGGFVISWMSLFQDGFGWGVYAQRYDSGGAAAGGEFRINSSTNDNQFFPSITGLGDGGFVVSWTSFRQEDGSGSGIFAQRYAADGTAAGGEFHVNSTTASNQEYPSITGLSDGGFVVVWASLDQDGSAWGIYAQRFDADGTASGVEFAVNSTWLGTQVFPTVTDLADGGFVVSWASYGQDGSGWGIYAQRYAADGSASGGEFLLNTMTASDQYLPVIAGLADGGFVVTWMSYLQDGSGQGVFVQRYGPANVAPGGPTDSDTATLNQLQENAAANAYSGLTASAIDADGDTLSFALTDDAGGRFAINAATGAITATGTTPLDYETALVDGLGNHYYEVTATAWDGTLASDPATFRILITNQVENLFTGGNNGTLAAPIDFNAMADGAYDFTDARYNALGGSDFVILPDLLGVDAGNPWDFAKKFNAGAGDDRIQGGTGGDFIDGGAGSDWLFGGDGNDKLVGGTGRDIVVGGDGSDQLTGSGDGDIFVFTDSELGTTRTGEHDSVTDFQKGSDKLDLSALYDAHAMGSISAGSAAAGAAVSNYGIVYNISGSKTFVYGDTDGIAGADFVIELAGKITLTAADLITTTAGWSAATAGLGYAPLHNDLLWA